MEIRIYDYLAYKKYVNDRIYVLPQNGRGQYRKIAEHLNINTVVVSQIFKGNRDLTLEHAFSLTQYFGMAHLEKEYFINLVQRERAGNHQLKTYFETKLKEIKTEAQKIKNIIDNKELNDEAKFQFYSNWYYSAIRLSTLLPEQNNVTAIANQLKLPAPRVREVVDFLLMHGLLKEEMGALLIGPQRTHLSAESPYINRHHTNWRLKGLENMEALSTSELFFTSPMTISQKVMDEVKVLLLDLVAELSKKVRDAKDEKLVCLNIDFFDVE